MADDSAFFPHQNPVFRNDLIDSMIEKIRLSREVNEISHSEQILDGKISQITYKVTCSLNLKVKLPPEPHSGNIEYKWKIRPESNERLCHLVSQMKWRLREGYEHAIYLIGVLDNGTADGISKNDLDTSLSYLKQMVDESEAEILQIKLVNLLKESHSDLWIAEIQLCSKIDSLPNRRLRIVVLGPSEAGKTTLISVLAYGQLDDGIGSSRLKLFRHLHEFVSGQTSSVTSINFVPTMPESSSEESFIPNDNQTLITLIDTPGCSKYQKTTLYTLAAYNPHFVFLVIDCDSLMELFNIIQNDHDTPNFGQSNITEFLSLASSLELQTIILVNKCDFNSSDSLKNEISTYDTTFSKLLPSKNFEFIDDSISDLLIQRFLKDPNTIITFPCSLKTGFNVQLVNKLSFYCAQHFKEQTSFHQLSEDPLIIRITSFMTPNQETEIIAEGLVQSGELCPGKDYSKKFYFGPVRSLNSSFIDVSTHHIVECGKSSRNLCVDQSISLLLKSNELKNVKHKKGLALLDYLPKSVCSALIASIKPIWPPQYSLTIPFSSFQAKMFCQNCSQQVRIIPIDPDEISSSSSSSSISSPVSSTDSLVKVEFLSHPEYITGNPKIFLISDLRKFIGVVLECKYI